MTQRAYNLNNDFDDITYAAMGNGKEGHRSKSEDFSEAYACLKGGYC